MNFSVVDIDRVGAVALAAAMLALTSGCSSQDDATDFRPSNPGPAIRVEAEEGDDLRIVATDLSALLVGEQQVDVTVGASALRASEGAFVIEVRAVDNQLRVSAARAHYAFASTGDFNEWTVSLTLPEPVSKYTELVAYNVVVSTQDGGVWLTRSLLHLLPFAGPRADVEGTAWGDALRDSLVEFEPFVSPLREALNRNLSEHLDIALVEMDRRGCPPGEFCERLDADYFIAMRRELARLHTIRDYWGNLYTNEAVELDEFARLTSAGPDEIAGTSDDVIVSFDYADLDFSAAGLSEEEAAKHGPNAPQ